MDRGRPKSWRRRWRMLSSEEQVRWVQVIVSIIGGIAVLAGAAVGWGQLINTSRQLERQARESSEARIAATMADVDRQYAQALALFTNANPSARLAGALELYSLAT